MHTTDTPILTSWSNSAYKKPEIQYFLDAAIVVKLILSQIQNISYEIANAVTKI